MGSDSNWRKPLVTGDGISDGISDGIGDGKQGVPREFPRAGKEWLAMDSSSGEVPGHVRDDAGDDDDLNPPWDRASARIPVPEPNPDTVPLWELDPVMERSYPGTSIETFTGTGKMPAVIPLRPGSSTWSRGVRAPRQDESAPAVPADQLELDDQPSVQMRAMRKGNLVRATLIVTTALMFSRVLGLLRTSLFASVFGAADQKINADAFTNAFAFPDMLFSVVAGGALASAFIPVFTSYMVEKRDREGAWRIASSALNIIMVLLVALAVLGIIFTPQFLALTLPTMFVNNNPEGPIVVHLTRIMLLQPIFLGGATIAIAILQARQSFVLPAIGQVIYTASLIGGILATKFDNETQIFGGHLGISGPAWGVVAGALLQFVIQLPGLRGAKMRYSFSFDIFSPGIREMFRLMLPRLLNAVILYVSVFVNRNLIQIAAPNSDGATWGYATAFTLIMLPNGIFGMAVSQAAFPTLAAYVAAGEWERLRATILRTIKGIIYLAVPSALGMMVLAEPICRVILSHGNFDQNSLPLFTGPLIYFGIGLTGLSLVEILTRSFYALQNTRTPTEVSILQFVFGIGLSLMLLIPMGVNGLALASSLAWTGEALVLIILLSHRLGKLQLRRLWVFVVNVVAASVVTALVALLVYTAGEPLLPVLPESPNVTAIHVLVRLAVAVPLAAGVYFGLSRFLGIDDAMPLDRILRRFRRR